MFDELIPVINRLQDIFTVTGGQVGSRDAAHAQSLVLELPQIVVVGSQSSGKSSVLESIVGKDFLPRGSGIVTRRPLVLQLFSVKGEEEWGEFLHVPDKKFFDFSQIRTEIERDTDRLTGENKGISENPINLKIFSPHVVNLTLVDLPGMTRVPVGDQPADIEAQIRAMVMRYIEPENAIILAVTAANSDIANSDALRLARDVDPSGQRTLGVLTKLDIMDQGTSALRALNNEVVPLRLGYVGVVNRSQQAIIDKQPIREALAAERRFFEQHAAYKSIAARCGVAYLSGVLHKLLLSHITAFVPTLRQRLLEMRRDAEQELQRCGPELTGDTPGSKQVKLLEIITSVSESYKHGLEMREDEDCTELASGARIHFIFNDVFGAHISAMDPLEGVSENDIKTCLHNAAGTRPALFIAEAAFELLARRQIELLREPALQCVDLVHEELRRVVRELPLPALERFTVLAEHVDLAFKDHLAVCSERAKQLLSNVVDCELAFINISHPNFAGADEVTSRMLKNSLKARQQPPKASAANNAKFSKKKSKGVPALRRVPGQIRAGSYQTDKEKFEIDVIKTLMISYFDIVRMRLRDLVPKSVMLFLVQKSQADFQNVLISKLYADAEQTAALLAEPDAIGAKRKDMRALIALLDKALTTLSQIGPAKKTFL